MNQSIDFHWEAIHADKQWGQYPAEYVIRFVARNFYKVPDRSALKILDYGCGGGAHAWYLAREGFDTYAFDGAPSAVKNTEARMRKEHLEAQFTVCDALETPYNDNFFDAVVDNYCIAMNSTNEIKKMYQEVYRILRPNGKLLTAQFGKKTSGYGTGNQIDENTWTEINNIELCDVGKTHFTDCLEIRQSLEETGFKNIEVDTILYTSNVETIVSLSRIK